MLAAGLTSVVNYWYRLFPRNPYARIMGLIPLVVLVVALIGLGLSRYVYGYHYSPNTVPLFSNDLKLIPSSTDELVVSDDEKPFYAAVSQYRPFKDMDVVSNPATDAFIVTRAANREFLGYKVDRIITNGRADDADRLYVYKKAD